LTADFCTCLPATDVPSAPSSFASWFTTVPALMLILPVEEMEVLVDSVPE
jgi:hypothetical protein